VQNFLEGNTDQASPDPKQDIGFRKRQNQVVLWDLEYFLFLRFNAPRLEARVLDAVCAEETHIAERVLCSND